MTPYDVTEYVADEHRVVAAFMDRQGEVVITCLCDPPVRFGGWGYARHVAGVVERAFREPEGEPAKPEVVVTTTQGEEVRISGARTWGIDDGFLTVIGDPEKADLATFAAGRWVAVRWAGESK